MQEVVILNKIKKFGGPHKSFTVHWLRTTDLRVTQLSRTFHIFVNKNFFVILPDHRNSNTCKNC